MLAIGQELPYTLKIGTEFRHQRLLCNIKMKNFRQNLLGLAIFFSEIGILMHGANSFASPVEANASFLIKVNSYKIPVESYSRYIVWSYPTLVDNSFKKTNQFNVWVRRRSIKQLFSTQNQQQVEKITRLDDSQIIEIAKHLDSFVGGSEIVPQYGYGNNLVLFSHYEKNGIRHPSFEQDWYVFSLSSGKIFPNINFLFKRSANFTKDIERLSEQQDAQREDKRCHGRALFMETLSIKSASRIEIDYSNDKYSQSQILTCGDETQVIEGDQVRTLFKHPSDVEPYRSIKQVP